MGRCLFDSVLFNWDDNGSVNKRVLVREQAVGNYRRAAREQIFAGRENNFVCNCRELFANFYLSIWTFLVSPELFDVRNEEQT